MKAFAELYTALDETTKTNEKVEALTRYFARVPPADAVWAATFASAGYLFGYAVLPMFKHYRLKFLAVVCLVAMVAWLVRVWRARWLSRRKTASTAERPTT